MKNVKMKWKCENLWEWGEWGKRLEYTSANAQYIKHYEND